MLRGTTPGSNQLELTGVSSSCGVVLYFVHGSFLQEWQYLKRPTESRCDAKRLPVLAVVFDLRPGFDATSGNTLYVSE